jgi:hypothetical protein
LAVYVLPITTVAWDSSERFPKRPSRVAISDMVRKKHLMLGRATERVASRLTTEHLNATAC